MFFRPGFAHRVKPALPIIHEEPTQSVQGGLPGEHYHLSAAMYAALISQINNPTFLEPVTSNSGEIVTNDAGDITTSIVPASSGATTGASVSSPSVSTPTVPDVVSPPVTVPAPVAHDPYWNQVVLAAIVSKPLGNNLPLVIGGIDQYHMLTGSGVGWAGGGSQLRGNALTIPGYNQNFTDGTSTPLNSVGAIDPSANFAALFFLFGTPLQYGVSAQFPSDFTVEQMVAMRTGAVGYLSILLGNSVTGFGIEYDESAAHILTYTYRNGSRQTEDTFAFPAGFPLARDTFHTLALSRTGLDVFILVNGIRIRQITFTTLPTFTANYTCWADLYGPVRVTKGFGRYGAGVAAYDATIPWIFK